MYEHQDEILLIYQNTHLLDRRSRQVILARVEGFMQMFDKLLTDAAREAGVPLANSYLAANIFTFLPTMIALRRWGVARVGPEVTISGLTDFLTRGMGFPLPGADTARPGRRPPLATVVPTPKPVPTPKRGAARRRTSAVKPASLAK